MKNYLDKIKLIQRSRKNPLAIVHKVQGVEVHTEYYIFGKEVSFHEFKKRSKNLPPFEIVVIEQ